jgi:polyphosphate kinase 2 (PPK2 family)
MLVRSGIILVKYWVSVSDDEQERRFLARINDPSKRWKLSPMDLQARARWVDYSEAKDQMFAYTDIPEAPWYVVEGDNKRAAHLNLISHFLSLVPYEPLPHDDIKLPPRQKRNYVRPPKSSQRMVPAKYEVE